MVNTRVMCGMNKTNKAGDSGSGIYLGVSVRMSMAPVFPRNTRDNVEDHLASAHPLSIELRRAPCPGSSLRYDPALRHSLVLSSTSERGQGHLLGLHLLNAA